MVKIHRIWIVLLVAATFAVLPVYAGNAPDTMQNDTETQENQTIPRDPPQHDVGRGPEHDTHNDVYRGPRIPSDGIDDDNENQDVEREDEVNSQDNHDEDRESTP